MSALNLSKCGETAECLRSPRAFQEKDNGSHEASHLLSSRTSSSFLEVSLESPRARVALIPR
eukprot:6484177-Amphidinium_carterae.1